MAEKDTRPDPGAETQGESQGNPFRKKEHRRDQDIVHLGEETQAAGQRIGDGQNEGGEAVGSKPGAEEVQGIQVKWMLKLK